jgi:hypothetical protein
MSARNVPAHEVKHKFGTSMEAGGYYFVSTSKAEKAGIVHGCPCGCGSSTLLYFRACGLDGAQEWDVTGEWPNVTLKPSIGIRDGSGVAGKFHWHGFLENGIFVEK